MKEKIKKNNVTPKMGDMKNKKLRRREMIDFGEDWKVYISKVPTAMAKQYLGGGIYNDGKVTIIVDEGDYLVLGVNNSMVYKVKKNEFEEMFLANTTSRSNKLHATSNICDVILGNSYLYSREVLFEENSFFKRLKFLFKGKMKIFIRNILSEHWKNEL